MRFVPEAPSQSVEVNVVVLHDYAEQALVGIPRLPFLIRGALRTTGIVNSIKSIASNEVENITLPNSHLWLKENETNIKHLFSQLERAEAFIDSNQSDVAKAWSDWLSDYYAW